MSLHNASVADFEDRRHDSIAKNPDGKYAAASAGTIMIDWSAVMSGIANVWQKLAVSIANKLLDVFRSRG